MPLGRRVRAMGMHVAAVDVHPEKLALAESLDFSWDSLERIDDIFARVEEGKNDGRIVVTTQ
jgi:D-arabinose 1-dehydrogenase-like Zn-dependent alcohol dehydrogenase